VRTDDADEADDGERDAVSTPLQIAPLTLKAAFRIYTQVRVGCDVM
jgi:hypothetical protein